MPRLIPPEKRATYSHSTRLARAVNSQQILKGMRFNKSVRLLPRQLIVTEPIIAPANLPKFNEDAIQDASPGVIFKGESGDDSRARYGDDQPLDRPNSTVTIVTTDKIK